MVPEFGTGDDDDDDDDDYNDNGDGNDDALFVIQYSCYNHFHLAGTFLLSEHLPQRSNWGNLAKLTTKCVARLINWPRSKALVLIKRTMVKHWFAANH